MHTGRVSINISRYKKVSCNCLEFYAVRAKTSIYVTRLWRFISQVCSYNKNKCSCYWPQFYKYRRLSPATAGFISDWWSKKNIYFYYIYICYIFLLILSILGISIPCIIYNIYKTEPHKSSNSGGFLWKVMFFFSGKIMRHTYHASTEITLHS